MASLLALSTKLVAVKLVQQQENHKIEKKNKQE